MAWNNTSSTIPDAEVSLLQRSGWNFTVTWESALGLSVVIANLIMLTLLLTKRSLRTPFTTYLLLLFASNAVSAMIYYPTEIVHEMTNQWLVGSLACTLKIYNNSVVAAVQTHSHLIITVNRIWAIAFPVSYKNHHTLKVALLTCFGMTACVNAGILPALVIDAMYYRLDERVNGCYFNYDAQATYEIAVQFIVFDFPTAFICGAYPFLWHRTCKRMRKVGRSNSFAAMSVPQKKRTAGCLDRGSSSLGSKTRPSAESNKRATRSFRLLTMLTVSVFICWTPDLMYYTTACFTTVPYDMVYTVIDNLYSVQSLLDPILFALSVARVRVAVCRIWRKISC